MAIDPSISLGVRTPEPLDLSKIQQIRNLAAQEQAAYQNIAASQQQIAASQAQQRATEAGIPGIQAETELKQRAAKFKQWTTDKANEFIDENGMPDPRKFSMAAARDGFYTEAQAIAAADLSNISQALANSRTQQDLNTNKFDFTQKALAHTANLLDVAPAEKRGQILNQYADFADKLVPGSGGQLRQSFQTDTIDKTGIPGVDDKKIKAVKEATATYLQQQDLVMRQAAQGLTFAQSAFTKNGQDPNSLESRSLRNFIERQSNGSIRLPDTVSAFDIMTKPIYKPAAEQYVLGQQMPTATRAEAVSTSAAIQSTIASYDAAINQLGRVKPALLATRLGTIGSTAFQRFIAQNPELAGLETAVQVHNNQFPNDPIDTNRQTVGEIKAKLGAGREQLVSRGAGAAAVAQQPTLPTRITPEEQRTRDQASLKILEDELARAMTSGNKTDAEAALRTLNERRRQLGLEPATMKNVKPAASTEQKTPQTAKTVRMVNKQGQFYNIPEEYVEEALKQGLKRAGR
jgi:hypothetical protein